MEQAEQSTFWRTGERVLTNHGADSLSTNGYEM